MLPECALYIRLQNGRSSTSFGSPDRHLGRGMTAVTTSLHWRESVSKQFAAYPLLGLTSHVPAGRPLKDLLR
jgi:hypothetical protein